MNVSGTGRSGEVSTDSRLSFDASIPRTLTVFDPIERDQVHLDTNTAVTADPSSPERVDAPVEAAVSIATDAVEVQNSAVYVRDATGEMVAEPGAIRDISLPDGCYTIELTTQIKLYLQLTAPLRIERRSESKLLSFGGQTDVVVGARSRHETPTATITTTRTPETLMQAVSALSSSLKTTTAERSFPSLRGHPPLIEVGEELQIPAELSTPDTAVQIEIPPDCAHVFAVAPLSYYLGATVVPGEQPRILTDDGFTYDLDGPGGFEATVEAVLRQVFFFDCVTRTEGLYRFPLHERSELEAIRELDLDFAALYEKDLSQQLEAYLDVPYSTVESLLPTWRLSSRVEPTADSIEAIPFLVRDLALVHSHQPDAQTAGPTAAPADEQGAVEAFMRTGGVSPGEASVPSTATATPGGSFTRSASGGPDQAPLPTVSAPTSADALEQAWVGDGAQYGSSKPTVQAYRNRLERTPVEDDIELTVVCNDPRMADERDLVETIYGSRSSLPFDVSVKRRLSVAQLRDVLGESVEFCHYIGHIDAGGFECTDGRLDASDLDTVGVDAFLLNACRSYEQGLELIEAGSIAGVVTMREIANDVAVEIGNTLARLLNAGFTFGAALSIASDQSPLGSQYVALGDGGLAVAQAESGTPNLVSIEEREQGYEVELTCYPTPKRDIGSLFVPYLESVETWFLNSGTISTFEISADELDAFLDLEEVPVTIDGELHWSTEIDSFC